MRSELKENSSGKDAPRIAFGSWDLLVVCLAAGIQSSDGLQDCGDVHGDRLLCGLRVWMDSGLFHNADRYLDLV